MDHVKRVHYKTWQKIAMDYLEFERPIFELENQIKEMRKASNLPGIDISSELKAMQKKIDELHREIYGKLTPWQQTQLARHPQRPHTTDYIQNIVTDFHEIAGDRNFADDRSMVCGFGYLNQQKVCIIGIEKGRKTQDKVLRNFGMPRPEGYRKALRVMKLAGQFEIPIITLVDTPGAYPGIGAEERGQSQAIAQNLMDMFEVDSPIISIIIGEGGSGGALGVAVADKVFMLEYAVYSVISPESCASILWADPRKAEQAANSLLLGAKKAKELNIIDDIISEPVGGAHRNYEKTAETLSLALTSELAKLKKQSISELKESRYAKFRQMGNNTLNGTEKILDDQLHIEKKPSKNKSKSE